MNIIELILAQNGTGAPAGPPAGGGGGQLLFGTIVFFVVFYFFLIRGDRKKQRQMNDMIKNLKKNDRVVTIGGIVGTVVSTKEDEIVVRVDESNNTKMTFVRKAIQRVLTEGDSATEPAK